MSGSKLTVCAAAAALAAAAFVLPTMLPFASYSLIGHRPLRARVQSGRGPSDSEDEDIALLSGHTSEPGAFTFLPALGSVAATSTSHWTGRRCPLGDAVPGKEEGEGR